MSSNPTSEQLLFFSDAVIAITITLLMLEIRLPVEANELSDRELLSALVSVWPLVLGYVVSFLVIATFWISHHRKFHHIARTTGTLVWLNFLFLLTIGLIPFATDVLTHNAGTTGTVLYAAVMTLAAVVLIGLWLYAGAAGLTVLDARARWKNTFPTLLSALIFAASIPVAFYWPDAAKYCWLLIIPVALMRRFRGDGEEERPA